MTAQAVVEMIHALRRYGSVIEGLGNLHHLPTTSKYLQRLEKIRETIEGVSASTTMHFAGRVDTTPYWTSVTSHSPEHALDYEWCECSILLEVGGYKVREKVGFKVVLKPKFKLNIFNYDKVKNIKPLLKAAEDTKTQDFKEKLLKFYKDAAEEVIEDAKYELMACGFSPKVVTESFKKLDGFMEEIEQAISKL